MKPFAMALVGLAMIGLAAAPALAQHQEEAAPAAPPGAAGQPTAEMACRAMMARMAGGAMARMMGGGPHSAMMQAMMGGQTDPASIGMTEAMGAGNMDARTMGHMLEMRGEMLRAIGDIMIKHGKEMMEEK